MANIRFAVLFTVIGFLLASLSGSLRAAPDKGLGMAIMSAVVSNTGTILYASGVTSVSKNSTGAYHVTFSRSIENCTPATSLLDGHGFGLIRVEIDPLGLPAPNTSLVNTYRPDTATPSSGAFADIGFALTMFCAE